MVMPVLEREEMATDPCEEVAKEDVLFAEAAHSLGYTPLRRAVRRQQDNAQLRSQLRLAGVVPFTTESVEKHKRAVIGNIYKAKCRMLAVVSGIVAAIFLSLSLVGWASEAFTRETTLPGVLVLSTMGWLVCVTLVAAVVFDVKESYQWELYPLQSFTDQVPEFAIQTALDIRSHCPYAEFFVCKLEQDPFLCVKIGHSDLCYIEVWNEPGFKQRREV